MSAIDDTVKWMVRGDIVLYFYWTHHLYNATVSCSRYPIDPNGIPLKEWWSVPPGMREIKVNPNNAIHKQIKLKKEEWEECHQDLEICYLLKML